MSVGNTRRVIGGVSAFAVAAGFAVTAGVGVAGAAPGSITWTDGNSKFTRTISDVTPGEGDIITSSTKFERTGGVGEYVQAVKVFRPSCMTYVDGSAKMNGSVIGLESQAADYTRVTGSWPVGALIGGTPRTFEFSYKVGANCDRDVALNTGMDYSGSLGSGGYSTKGPTISVRKNVSTTALAAVPAGVKVGQSVPLSATVTGGVDGNIVEFYDGTTKLGQGPLAAGKATFAWTPAAAGGHSLTAKFLGTAKANESVSAAQNVPVSPVDVVTTTAVSGPATAVAGADVVLNVQVSPAPNGGTVQFKDGATNIGGPVTLGADGKGSITQKFGTGARSITAVYSGAGEFLTSTSAAHTVAVSPADVVTTTVVTGPATAVAGTDATFAVQVSPVPAGGTVQFKNGAENLGGPVTLDTEGKGSITQALAKGDHQITAVYSGAGEFLTSTSAAHTVAVSPADVATTTVVTGPASAVAGADVVLNVQVSPAPAGGTVQFKDGTENLGGPVTLDNEGKGSITQALAKGDHQITAVYSGAGEFLTSTSAAHAVAVSPADVATTTVVSGPASAVAGADVVLNVQVSPAPAGGTVQFKDGTENLGGPVALDSEGKGSITQKFVKGDRSITAVYSGLGEFQGSTSATHTVAVSPADVATTTVVSGPASAVAGADVVLNVQVSPAPAGGTVQFKDGTENLGGPVALDSEGKGSITQKFVKGDRSITAVYSGLGEFQGSTSAAHTVAVSPADVATTTVVSGPASAVAGADVVLNVQVSPAPAGGTVQFKDGTENLGGPVALDSEGKGSITQKFVKGDRSITAVYSGLGEFQGSTSAAHTVAVSPADVATTTVVSGPASAVAGADVVLNVQVSPAPAGGTVQFKDGTENLGGPVNLDSEGKGSITQKFAAGTRSITAVYSGAGEFQGSTSAAHTVTVSAPVPTDVATTTTATAPATATTGVAVDLWAKVKGPNGDPIPSGGTIFFKDGGALIGKTVNAVNGEAKLSHTFTTVGAHTITAEFGGTTGFLTSVSQSSTVEVSAPVITDVATTTVLAMPATAKNGAAVNLVATVSPTPAGGTVQFMDGATPLGAPVGLLAGKATRSQAFTTAGEHQITAIYSGAPGHLTSTTEVGIITVDEPVEGGNGAGGSLGNLFGSS